MKKKLIFIIIPLVLNSCSAFLVAPTVNIKGNLLNYTYIYVIPTSSVTSSSGIYGGSYGIYGGATKSINPSEVISGYLMKKGYTPVPSVTDELAEKTLVISYGYTGRRQIGLFSYASCIIIQVRDAKTHEMVASCESEGCGEDETDDILQAINSGLNKIFSR